MMCIRPATPDDFPAIRRLPVQLTPRPGNLLPPKYYRVLSQEAGTSLLVFEDTHAVSAFMALRFTPAIDSTIRYLVIAHLSLDRHALRQGIAAELEAHATVLANEHRCAGMLVKSASLPGEAARFYRERGYVTDEEAFIKKLA